MSIIRRDQLKRAVNKLISEASSNNRIPRNSKKIIRLSENGIRRLVKKLVKEAIDVNNPDMDPRYFELASQLLKKPVDQIQCQHEDLGDYDEYDQFDLAFVPSTEWKPIRVPGDDPDDEPSSNMCMGSSGDVKNVLAFEMDSHSVYFY